MKSRIIALGILVVCLLSYTTISARDGADAVTEEELLQLLEIGTTTSEILPEITKRGYSGEKMPGI